jgi:hypothetical protein
MDIFIGGKSFWKRRFDLHALSGSANADPPLPVGEARSLLKNCFFSKKGGRSAAPL